MSREIDVLVVGAGPGGSAAAIHAAEAGLNVCMIEKDSFPRYHIGESLTGIAGNAIRDLGLDLAMKEAQFPVKSGVKVIGKTGNEYFVPVLSPTWQVRRDSFDAILLDRAKAAGAELRHGRVRRVDTGNGEGVSVQYADGNGEVHEIRARALVDASGTACLLCRLGVAGQRRFDAFGDQIAVFSQIEGAARDPGEMGDNTFIFHAEPNHWAWFIPLSSTIVSVGIVVPNATFRSLGQKPEEVFDWGLRSINPELSRRTLDRPLVEPVRAIKDYSYRIEPFAGPGWFCVGDAHRFADPIFSFGVTVAMQESKAAVEGILAALSGERWERVVSSYTRYSNGGQDAIFDFISYFWKFPAFFGLQMRGKFRKDVVRLFGGDIFVPNQVVDRIREFMADASSTSNVA